MVTTVAHLSSVHPAGDNRIRLKECRTLAEAGYQVLLIAPHDRPQTVDGIRLVPFGRSSSRWRRLLTSGPRMYLAARRAGARVYHFHDPELLGVGVLLKLSGARVVYDVHEDVPSQILGKHWIPTGLRRGLSAATRLAEGLAGRCCDAVVVACPYLLERFPPPRGVLVENFPRLEELAGVGPQPYAQREPLVCYVGGIAPARGAEEMVRAMGLLPAGGARLALAGNFSPPALEEQLRALPGAERTDLLGWQSREQVAALLGRARIGLCLLHPLRNYLVAGHPTKVMEYMAAGIPAVVSDLPLLRETVEETGCGLVVPAQDPEALAEGLQWLLDHPQEAEQMGRRGRQAAERTYNWDREAARLLALYHRLAPLAAAEGHPQPAGAGRAER